MFERIEFKNFKVLRDATLKLGPLTLLVGPNGSGKSTVLQALQLLTNPAAISTADALSVGAPADPGASVTAWWRVGAHEVEWALMWGAHGTRISDSLRFAAHGVQTVSNPLEVARSSFQRIRVYSLSANDVARPVPLTPKAELEPSGERLAVVLDRLRDENPERFEALNAELHRWIPEFDRVLFETPAKGQRAFALRTAQGHFPISARNLSQGTLFALVLLTLAYLPEPPPVIGLEEPDHGMHPRLLRDVQDAIYRLAYPEQHGEKRAAVQVIATTHSPYLVDLFRDHLDEIVIASKVGSEAKFERLADHPRVEEILGECALGDAWYTGILGGVPTEP